MALLRRFAPLLVSVGLVVALGAVGLLASAGANSKAEALHRRDREILQNTLAGLGHQYVLFAVKEEYDFASSGPWSLQVGDPGDIARLQGYITHSPLLNYGAAIVGLDNSPLSLYSVDPAGLPAPSDPGFRPLVSGLMAKQPGVSSVMKVGDIPVVGLGVPIMQNGVPRAVLIAFFRADRSPLQTYVESLKYGKTGKGAVVDSEGTVIAAADAHLVGRRVVDDRVTRALARGKSGFMTTSGKAGETSVSYAPIGMGGWGSVTTQSATEFFGPLKTGRQHIDLALAAVLAAAAAGLALLNHKQHTASRRETNTVRLLQALAGGANEASSLQEALQMVVDRLCSHSGWPVGHAWLRHGDALVSSPVWHVADPGRYHALRLATEDMRVTASVGVPGLVLDSREPAWITNIDGNSALVRSDVARSSGLRAVYAFPVIVDGEVVAVLEFFADRPRVPETSLLEIMRHVGAQLSHVVERERAEDALRRSEERFRSLVQNGFDLVTVGDAQGTITYDSPAVERIFGYTPEERVGHPVFDYIHPDDHARARDILARVFDTPKVLFRLEARCRRKDGEWRWIEVGVTNLLDDPSVCGIVANQRDITERRAFQEQLTHQAYHDALTKLPNRALFQSRLDVALARASRRQNTIAVLFVDLDRFKVINDSLGHETGDELLVAVAERLSHAVRGEDTVARMSGDEFTVLLEEVEDETEAARVARRVIDDIRQPIDLGGHQVFVGASVGIALSHNGQDRAEDLLRDADLAMYRAKERGRSRYEVFETTMGARARLRLDLEAELRRALDNDELVLHYQPEVSLVSGSIVGTEALVRWEHPERGLLMPETFIPVAEETGLILALGRQVLERACRQAEEWQRKFPTDPPRRMSVNVSGRQLPTLLGDVRRVLERTGVDPRSVVLEIIESVVMDDPEAAIPTFKALRELGVSLAIDDFGTGYSSLSWLKHFPISTLKLDKSFVAGLGVDEADRAIAQSVLTMAECLDVTVTAEGVETAEQAIELARLGCRHGQGYHFARPQPAADVERLLATAALLG